jgi:hypothetical protein
MFQGAGGVSINAAGAVTGFVRDPNNVGRGFVRAANGSITEFDAPGAGAGTTPSGQGTYPVSINTAGQLAGFYEDNNSVYHGFIRNADGMFVTPTIDVPAADEVDYHLGTVVSGIDAVGDVTGFYRDSSMVTHGFMRLANGTMIYPIDAPGADTTDAGAGTLAFSINAAGTITGRYWDTNFLYHGFIRKADGTYVTTPIDPQGAGGTPSAGNGTSPFSINSNGDITGSYSDASGVLHGFVRSGSTGAITLFDVPGAGKVLDFRLYSLEGTFPVSINDFGVIVGFYGDLANAQHCFVRAANGTINTYDVAGAGTPGTLGGTACTGINGSGEIVGLYTDTDAVFHGFVLTPAPATATRVGALPNPVMLNGTTALTATVTSTTAGTITGEVTFKLGATTLGSAPVSGGKATPVAVAVTAASGFVVGTNTIVASYSGDSNFAPSNGSTGLEVTIPPAPTITTLSLFVATVGGAAFTLTVNGTNFVSGATVYWNGTALATTYVSATQLTASVPAGLIA